ncbi:MAG: hypothetical protein WCP98_22230 [Actinomycetes bacterium]
MVNDGGRSDDAAARRDEAPRGSARARQEDETAERPTEGLTEDELRWIAGGTKPTEDEPFLPG